VKQEHGRFDTLVNNAAKPVATTMPGGLRRST
jgi:hypothetical protein